MRLYLIIIVWLAVLTHRLISGDVSWPFVVPSFICWNLILAIGLDTSGEVEI